MSNEAFVTLATNDTYGLGALVLGRSLRRVATSKQTVVMVTPDVSQKMKDELAHVFNLVVTVNTLDSGDAAHLALMSRPELGVTFTKLHAWRLVQFSKCVFLDADTLVVQNCDELFEREELSAAPDPGWPDCFNSGVFVFVPSEATFNALLDFAIAHGSFDGGDQGLLNMFFSDWATGDIRKHLPFIYNVVSSATYSYLPALKQFGSQVKIAHFLGNNKPWLRQSQIGTSSPYQRAWWSIFREDIAGRLSQDMAGVAGVLAREEPDDWRREAWEAGDVDYLGRDSFDNIWRRICECVGITAQTLSAPAAPAATSAGIANQSSAPVAASEEIVEATSALLTEKPLEPVTHSEKPTESLVIAEKPIDLPLSTEITEESIASVEKPTEAIISAEKLVEPVVCTQKSLEPVVCTQKSVEPVVCPEKPLEPVVCPEKPLEPVICPEKPLEPVVCPKKPLEPVVCPEKPLEPVVCSEKPLEPVVCPEKPVEPAVTEEKTVEPVVSAAKPEETVVTGEKSAESVVSGEKSTEPVVSVDKPTEPILSVEKPVEHFITSEKLPETVIIAENASEPSATSEKQAPVPEKLPEAAPVVEKIQKIVDKENTAKSKPIVEKPSEVPKGVKIPAEQTVKPTGEEKSGKQEASIDEKPLEITEKPAVLVAETTTKTKTAEKLQEPPITLEKEPKEVLTGKISEPSPTVEKPVEIASTTETPVGKSAEHPPKSVKPTETAEVCPLKPAEPKSTAPPTEGEARIQPPLVGGDAPVCRKEPGTPTITPPSGPASPQPADVPPEVCKLQATPSQPATPPASSHQTTDAPVPPKRKQGKNGKSGKGKK